MFAEPVGRLIRRTVITVEDGVTRLANPYEKEHGEFIRSTDPLFRPVNMITAPDGTLYIVDMYRGIIQQGNWTQKGSYLREQIDALDMEKHTGRGRIYRLRHDGFRARSATAHARRDSRAVGAAPVASQWLVARHRAEAARPASRSLGRAGARETGDGDSADPRPRLHALWTLDGLGALDDKLILRALKSGDPQVRMAGLRLAEAPLVAKPTRARAAGRRRAGRAARRRSARHHPGHAVRASRRVCPTRRK